MFVREGQSRKECEIEGSTKRPCCQRFCFVFACQEQFRRCVESGATEVGVLVRVKPPSSSEVDEFAGFSPDVHKYVLWFDISVYYPGIVVEVP